MNTPASDRHEQTPACLVLGHDLNIQEVMVARLEALEYKVFSCGENTSEALRLLGDWDFGAIMITQGLGMRGVLQLLHLLHGQQCPIYVLGGTSKRHNFFDPHGAHGYYSIPGQLDEFLALLKEQLTKTSNTGKFEITLEGLNMQTVRRLHERDELEIRVDRFIGTMPEWFSEIEEAVEENNHFMIQNLAEHIVKAARELGAMTVAQTAHVLLSNSKNGEDVRASMAALEDSFHVVFRSLLTLRHV